MAHPRGESGSNAVRLDFDRRLMLQFRGSLVTSDAGLLAYRELDDVLGLTEMAGHVLADARSGKNGRHALAGLFRQSVFGRLAGYEDVNDAERLRPIRLCAGLSAAKRRRGARLRRVRWGASRRNGSRRPRTSLLLPTFWPVDRPCARPKATPWHRARHGFKREPDPRRAGERLERPLRLHLLSPAVRVQPVWRPRTLCSRAGNGTAATAGTTCSSPSWRATRARSHASIFERTRPLQCPRSTSCAGCMPISAIRPEPGPSRGGLSPRSSGIPENFIPASASS